MPFFMGCMIYFNPKLFTMYIENESIPNEIYQRIEQLRENIVSADKAKLFEIILTHHPKGFRPLNVPEITDIMGMHQFVFMYPNALIEFEEYLNEKYQDSELGTAILFYIMSGVLGIEV